MVKNIAAGIAGVIIAVGLVWLIEMIGHAVYPPPPDIDFSNADAIRGYIANLPPGAFLFVGCGWFIGTLCGTMAACRIGTAPPWTSALVIGGFMLAATAFNLTTIPHPLWFSVVGIAAIVVAAWIGMVFGSRLSNS